MNTMELQPFFPSSTNIDIARTLIKKQGIDVCQNKITQKWIDTALHKHSFGFIVMMSKAQLGRRSIKKPDSGFIICRVTQENPGVAWIDLVCSRVNSKVGKLLMEVAENHLKTMPEVYVIQLYSLPEPKLKRWYSSMGYGVSDVTIWDGISPKAYLMTKRNLVEQT